MADTIKEQLLAVERTLDRELSKHPIFLRLERSTGVKKTHAVGLFLAAVLFLFALRIASNIILALVAFLYPAMMTVTAIERHDKSEDTHWLAYWLVLAGWSTIESLTGELLVSIIPLYAVVKLAICVWLFMPQTRGATMVYERVVRPVVLTVRDHPSVQEAVGKVHKGASEASKAANRVADDIRSSTKEAVREAAKEASKIESSIKSKKEE
jgi:receptor expression-enhancing protein 5/6